MFAAICGVQAWRGMQCILSKWPHHEQGTHLWHCLSSKTWMVALKASMEKSDCLSCKCINSKLAVARLTTMEKANFKISPRNACKLTAKLILYSSSKIHSACRVWQKKCVHVNGQKDMYLTRFPKTFSILQNIILVRCFHSSFDCKQHYSD